MKSKPILEELWRVKDDLAREAGYDVHRLCENTRRWAAEHPHSGPVLESVEDLQRLAAEQERRRAQAEPLALKEDRPRKR